MRRLPALAILICLAAGAAHAADRYGPDAPLRGRADATTPPVRLLTWASRESQRGRSDAPPPQFPPQPPAYGPVAEPAAYRNSQNDRAQAPQTPVRVQPPLPWNQRAAAQPVTGPSAVPAVQDPQRSARLYGGAAGRPTAAAGSYAPLIPRRYSVGREFGVQPDRIAMPDPSVVAFGPDVGAAYAASNARKDDGGATLSPADMDQLEQADQEDARRESRQKARDKAAAAKN